MNQNDIEKLKQGRNLTQSELQAALSQEQFIDWKKKCVDLELRFQAAINTLEDRLGAGIATSAAIQQEIESEFQRLKTEKK